MLSGRKMRAVGLAAAVALGVAACGGDAGTGEPDAAAAEPLKLGYLFPETGDLAFLGPPQISAAKFAIEEINKAGGVLGKKLPAIEGSDEGEAAETVSASTDRLLSKKVHAILGAAASGRSLDVIDKIKDAGVVQCSGSNTAPTFTDYKDDGFYFRTAPSDVLQGPILADTVIEERHEKVAVTFRQDDYGQGLADATVKALEEAGAEVTLNEGYEPKTKDWGALVGKIKGTNPDAVVMVAFEEGIELAKKLDEAGIGADQMFSADGLRKEDLGKRFSKKDPKSIAGFMGTAPASAENKDFVDNLKKFDPKLDTLQFAPQVYDCAITVALAAEAAKSTDPSAIKEQMVAVTKDGEKCDDFTACRDLVKEGKDINYEGASGPLDFIDEGEPGATDIEIYKFDKKGELTTVDTVPSKPLE